IEKEVSTYAFQISEDLGNSINHTIRCMMVEDDPKRGEGSHVYVENLRRQNHWKTPTVSDGQYRHFSIAIHQMLGYGGSAQDAPMEHVDDVLLLQVYGDPAFFNWQSDTGCVLHFW